MRRPGCTGRGVVRRRIATTHGACFIHVGVTEALPRSIDLSDPKVVEMLMKLEEEKETLMGCLKDSNDLKRMLQEENKALKARLGGDEASTQI